MGKERSDLKGTKWYHRYIDGEIECKRFAFYPPETEWNVGRGPYSKTEGDSQDSSTVVKTRRGVGSTPTQSVSYTIPDEAIDFYKSVILQQRRWRGDRYKNTIFAAEDINDLIKLGQLSYANVSAPQYGPKLQGWMQGYANWEQLSGKLNVGDSKTTKGYLIEQKWTLNHKVAAHGVQCRLWQDCDGYVFGSINPDTWEVEMFYLTKDELKNEVSIMKCSASHGTKEANKTNSNIEYTVTVKRNSADHQRWNTLYKKELAFFKTL